MCKGCAMPAVALLFVGCTFPRYMWKTGVSHFFIPAAVLPLRLIFYRIIDYNKLIILCKFNNKIMNVYKNVAKMIDF